LFLPKRPRNLETNMQSTDLAGKWTYRSFFNDPAMVGDDRQKALDLIFAEATFTFGISGNQLKGIIDWGSGGLDLTGTVCPAGPLTVQIVGMGRYGTQTAGWRYDHNGMLAHEWPNAVSQLPAVVGTVIRVNAHGPQSPAGVTASFIAVKQPASQP
jgi:hypothetical protein